MRKVVDKFYNLVDKIGKMNLALFFFVLIILIIARLYNTFSLNTQVSESFVNGIKTYEFILNSNNENNSVIVTGNSQKYISIKISNPDNIKLKYNLYYSSDDALTNVYIGTRKESSKPSKGLIDGKENYIIDVNMLNLSDSNVTINFGVEYGLEKGGDLELPDDKVWLSEYKGPVLLNEMEPGSYVYYEGNNGCNKSSCMGVNANYSDDNKGYCYGAVNSYKSDGWRIAYIKKSTAYIISAGAVDCLSSDKDGNASFEEVTNSDETLGLSKHITNLNKKALLYCNRRYAYGNTCSNKSSWAMDVNDFRSVTNQYLSSDKCFKQKDNKECGFDNGLIDIGGYYWIANVNNAQLNTAFYWDATDRFVNSSVSSHALGLRPVIRLKEAVYVIDGKGTEEEPYLLDTFREEDFDVVEDNNKDKITKLSDYIQDKYKSSKDIITVNMSSDESISVNESKDTGIMLDNNNIYRYYGENPNNYVMFNDELWRIISMSNVKTNKDDASGSKRVKIIRIGSIGSYSYDSNDKEDDVDGSSNWAKAELMTSLNQLYYNQAKGTCYNGPNKKKVECDFSIIGFDSNARYLIDDAMYYLAKEDIDVSDADASEYWELERSEKTWTGKVGIIYGSDYMYAADLNVCKEKSSGYKDNKDCNNNWLYKVYNNTISNLEIKLPSTARDIYPTVYLKNNVGISDGKGTEEDPFILEIID
ncbi:MAG: hypothetical protein VZS44_04010 [Bacilli bacterium]|nr:hypothetical protein [Bacilli bacterium]